MSAARTRGDRTDGAFRRWFPDSVDINPTAKCNLDCTFCWGPDHDVPDGLSTAEWQDLMAYFRVGGSSAIVFTGGEPTLRPDIGTLLQTAATLGYRVTLSTNGLLLRRKLAQIVPWIHEIGLPIDGATPDGNAAMRLGRMGGRALAAVLDGMARIRDSRPEVEITVRTVVSRVNVGELDAIGDLLHGRSPLWDRWKLYQFVSAGIGSGHEAQHELDEVSFQEAVRGIRESCRGRVTVQSAADRTGRYIFVGPRGELLTASGPAGYTEIGTWERLREGADTLAPSALLDPGANRAHGAANAAHEAPADPVLGETPQKGWVHAT
jgi:MoaA/NifB/PqqE/SkfB family radical SAM enzyme